MNRSDRELAYRCKDYADGWIYFKSYDEASKYQDETNCLMQVLGVIGVYNLKEDRFDGV